MAEERIPTSAKLAEALRQTGAPDDMIGKAESGYYDDFKSPLAFPIRELVNDSRNHGIENIAIRAMEGEFDAQKWEAEAWSKSSEAKALGRQIMRDAFKNHS